MKVIFVKDVPRVGRRNEIKEQPDGYVRNFLLPKGLVIVATPEAVKKIERAQNEIRVERELQGDLFKKNLRAVADKEVTIRVKTNAKGHLFQSIHVRDIVAALKKEHRIIIEEQFVHLPNPIKETGTFTATAEAVDMKENITVTIVPE